MNLQECLNKTPWDNVFGFETYEISNEALSYMPEIMAYISNRPGHYTVKVHPLTPKKLLHDFGFYYCDSLSEAYCLPDELIVHQQHDHEIQISQDVSIDQLLPLAQNAFEYSRFYRDFNLDQKRAEKRFENWLRQLYHNSNVYGYIYNDKVIGFFGYENNRIALHATDELYRGSGLTKYFWSLSCAELFKKKYTELFCIYSAANMPMLNLCVSMGFKFRKCIDVYHKLILPRD